MKRVIVGVLVFATATLYVVAQKMGTDVEVVGHITQPAKLQPSVERVRRLRIPPGFAVSRFAEGLGGPRIIAVASDGTVYVTRRTEGDCLMLRDTNGDGRADERKVVAQKPGMHGIAIDGDRVYLATVKEVYVAQRNPDGSLGELREIISDLPDGGQHPNRTLAIGPDRMLYITVGSTCNECFDTSPQSATVLRTTLDGSGCEIFASGLRNTIGLSWHPETGELWGMDHGIDWLGDNDQPEELNLLKQGSNYGWPLIYANGKVNPHRQPPEGQTTEQAAKMTTNPVLMYTAHAAPMQLVFYTSDQFPAEYRNNAFVTMRGSWNRRPPSGYEVVRIRFANGKPTAFEPFFSGFLTQQPGGWGTSGRPVGLALMRDGSLLVGDDTGGVIYRVSYEGTNTRSRHAGEAGKKL